MRHQNHPISRPQLLQLYYPTPRSQRALLSTTSSAPDETPIPPEEEENKEPAVVDDSSKSNVPITYVEWPNIGETARLGVKTLGRPGNVFLLGEEEIRQRNKGRTTLNNIATKKWNGRQVLKQLDEEENEVSDSSYAKINLERIRSTRQAHDVILKNEWDTLRTAIVNGFTIAQLSNYIREFGRESIETNDSTWRPGASLFQDSDAGKQPIDQVKERGEAARESLAEEILRDCWKLEIRGEIGQLHLTLGPRDIVMLLNAKNGPLKEFAETHGVKIDVSRPLSLISITGGRASCESVVEPIRDYVSRICSTKLSILPPYASSSVFPKDDGRFDAEFLEWLGDNYGVDCDKRQMLKKGIDMVYLSDKVKDSEEARRILGLGLILKRHTPSELCMRASSIDVADVNPISAPDSLSWLENRKEWFRWTMPAKTPDSLPSLEASTTSTGSCPSQLSNFVRNVRLSKYKSFEGHRLRAKTTATVGKSLFLKSPALKDKSISAADLKKITSRSQRLFINDIPDTHSFLGRVEPARGDTSQTPHKIRLIPSPFAAHEAPAIELELDLSTSDPASKPSIRTARAVLNERSMDLLLPQNTLDLKFTKTIFYDLLEEGFVADKSESDATVASILKSVEPLGYRLPLTQTQPPVPPFCRLMIPKKLLLEADKKNSPRQDSSSGDETVEVEYMFPPLRSLLGSRFEVFNYKDLNLSFSRSFTGPMLADQTTNLSLGMELVSAVGSGRSSSASFNTFYGRARALASELSDMEREAAV